jgi:hypothetical protein
VPTVAELVAHLQWRADLADEFEPAGFALMTLVFDNHGSR